MTLSEQLKEQRKETLQQKNSVQRASTKLSEQLKMQRQNVNTNPVASTLKNASVIQKTNLPLPQENKTEGFENSLPVSATAIKLQTGNNGNKFYTGINPREQKVKQQLQEKAYEQIKNSNAVKDLKTYVQAEKQFQNTLPETEEDNYLEYKSKAQQTEDMVEKAKYNVMAEKSKKHGDLYYGTTQTLKTIGTGIVDSFVNAGQFVKNAFKSEMQKEIRDAWESIATFSSPDYKRKFKALRDVSDEQANKVAQNAINSAKQVLRKYNITVPDNVNAEYARQMIADIDEWVYKENKLEETTRTAHEKVQQENQALGPIGKTITQTADVVSQMVPTIVTNTVLPGAGSASMFLSSAQSSSEQALKEGATYEQAIQRGILSGATEVATEMIGGENLSKLTGIPTLFKKFGINTSNKLAQVLLDVGSEGLEEMVSTGVQPIIDRITYNPESKFATASDYWQSFKDSILPTLFFVGVNQGTTAINNYKLKAIEKVEKSNMTVEQKEQAKGEIEKGAQEMIQQLNSQTTPQNNTNLAETSPNNANISQDNVQNAQDFEKTVQNDEKVNSQEIKTRELQKAVQTYIEKAKNNFNTKINIAKIENISNLKQESESTIYKKARDLFSNLKKKIFVNNGENIHVTNTDISESIGKTVRNGYQKELLDVNIAVFSQLDKIIENGEKILPNVPELKNRSKYQTWDYYATPIMYNGQKYIVEFDTVIRNDGEKHFRLERVFPLYKNEEPSMDVPTKKLTTPLLEGSSVNNIIPTSQNYVNNQQEILPSTEQLKAQDLKQGEEAYNMLNMKKPKLEKIAELTEEQANLPTMTYKQRADKNTPYRRKFWDNVESSKIISKDVKEQVNMTNYDRKHNADVLEKMKERLDTEPMKVAQEWFRKDIKKATDQDVALGAILMERYQAEGRFDEAVDVVEKLADMGTEAGRTVQMYSIFQRLTPEGMMIYQQRKLNSALETLTQKQTGKWVEQNKDKFKLTEDDATFITAKVQEAQNAPTERQKQIALAEIETRINDKLPPEAGQSVKAFRRIAMLFNPKTQVRNIAGNVTVMPLNYVTDLVATGIDKAIAKKTGVRTTALPNVKTIGKGFKKGAAETIDDYKRGIRTTPTGSRYEIQNNAKSFNENTNSKVKNAINNKLNTIDRILSTTLELGDRPFYEAAYQNALETQMKANRVTEPTQEMIDIASNVALSQTWQDNNNYTQAVLGIRNAMNALNIKGFGFGDLVIPFAKTPANLTKAMVEYSPAGLIPTLINYNDMQKAISRGDMTAMQQKKFVTSVGKTIAGTLLYIIAGALVQGGAVTGSSDEDKDIANFEKNVLGIQPYSIKIGDKTFTYNWANPIATPFAVMADTYKMSKENAKLNEILLNTLKVGVNQLAENSFLQGVQELLTSTYGEESLMDNLVGAIMDLPTQFTPTLLGQIATQFDSTKRQTFENGDSVGTMINEVKNKIPGFRNELAPQVNTFGEEIQNYGGDNNSFNVFLNPGNISSTNATDTQKELYALYKVTKDKTIFPRQAPYSVSGGGEKAILSSQDRAEYQKTSGQYVTEQLDALFDSEFYKTLEDNKKVDVIAKIVSDADTTAKDKWVDTDATQRLAELKSDLEESGIPLLDYYNAWVATQGIESDKNWKGETITNSKSKKQKEAIDKATPNLDKWERRKLYEIFNVGKSVW